MFWLLLVATTAPLPTTVVRLEREPVQASLLIRDNIVVMHGIYQTQAQCEAVEAGYDGDHKNTAFCVLAR